MKKQHAIYLLSLIITTSAIFLFFNQTPLSDNRVFKRKGILDDVHITLQTGDILRKVLMDEKYTFIYFKYTIENNNSKNAIFFDPGLIKVNYNGLTNRSTEYDALASAMTEASELPRGVSVYSLYLVFDQHTVERNIIELELIESGIFTDETNYHVVTNNYAEFVTDTINAAKGVSVSDYTKPIEYYANLSSKYTKCVIAK